MTDENGMVGFYESADRANYPYSIHGRGISGRSLRKSFILCTGFRLYVRFDIDNVSIL